MATLKDVAALCGISTAAVSLYLNGKAAGRISEQKQKEIEDAVIKLGYRRQTTAQKISNLSDTRHVFTIAVYWATDSRSVMLGEVVSGLHASLLKHKNMNPKYPINVVISPYESGKLYEEEGLLKPDMFGYDAAIIGNTSIMDMDFLESITPTIPIVLLNRRMKQYSSASIDNVRVGDSFAELLAKKGYSAAAIFRTSSPYFAMNARVAGFIEGCRKRKLALPNGAIIYTEDSLDGGIHAAKKFLSISKRPEVVFCDSDSIALGALHEFHRNSIRVPQDISIVSVCINYPQVARCSIPPLTVVNVPIRGMAQSCMDCAIDILLGNAKPPVYVELKASMTEGGSLKENTGKVNSHQAQYEKSLDSSKSQTTIFLSDDSPSKQWEQLFHTE